MTEQQAEEMLRALAHIIALLEQLVSIEEAQHGS